MTMREQEKLVRELGKTKGQIEALTDKVEKCMENRTKNDSDFLIYFTAEEMLTLIKLLRAPGLMAEKGLSALESDDRTFNDRVTEKGLKIDGYLAAIDDYFKIIGG